MLEIVSAPIYKGKFMADYKFLHPVKCPVKSFAFSKGKSEILFNRAILPSAKLFNRVKVL